MAMHLELGERFLAVGSYIDFIAQSAQGPFQDHTRNVLVVGDQDLHALATRLASERSKRFFARFEDFEQAIHANQLEQLAHVLRKLCELYIATAGMCLSKAREKRTDA